MKTNYYPLRRLTTAALALSCSLSLAETKSATPILPETFGTVVIGDIPGLLDKIGALASKVMPGINASMIRQQAGAMLGDPELAGLPAGSGLAVVIPKQGMPFGFLEVSADKIADYQKLLKARGPGAVEEADGLLVAGADEESLGAAKALASQVKSDVLAGKGTPTLSGAVKLADVLKQYDPVIQAGIAKISKTVERAESATSGTESGNAENIGSVFRGYYAVAKQVETLELSLQPSSEAMTMHYDITPLKKNADAGAPDDAAAKMMKLLPGNGAIRGQASFDMAALAGLIGDVAKEIGADDGTSKINVEALTAWFKECSAAFGGSMAMTLMSDASAPLSGAYAFTVKDEAAALKVLKDMPEKLESTGFTKLYAAMGMPMKIAYKENVRKYKDTSIHEMTIDMDFSRGSEEDQKRMEKLMGNMVYEIAMVDKILLYAVKPEKIESLIDAAKAGSNPAAKDLVSSQKLAPGGSGYFDYNIGQAMLFAVGLAAKEGDAGTDLVKNLAGVVKDAPPLQVGWYNEANKFRLTIQMPAETLSAFVQAGQQASMAAKSKAPGSDMEESTSSKRVRTSGPRPSSAKQSK